MKKKFSFMTYVVGLSQEMLYKVPRINKKVVKLLFIFYKPKDILDIEL